MLGNLFSFLNKGQAGPFSKVKPIVLLVLDGYGMAPPGEGNAIASANRPNVSSYYNSFPHGELIASGESVGLPANEVGNTEVGHLTLGAGRVIDQDLVRINKSIKDTSFYDNSAFLKAMDHVRKQNSKLHIAGLVGSGNVHSSLNHLWALIEFCRRNKIKNVCFHLFTDGRDSPPQESITLIPKIEVEIANGGLGKIASISGRYFAMDRDGRWDRTKLTYDALTKGVGLRAKSATDAIKNSYLKGKTDEFIEPTIIEDTRGNPVGLVNDNDAFIFYNFRIDRPRQLSMAFTIPNFENLKEFDFGKDPEKEGKKAGKITFVGGTFKREKVVRNLFFVTITEYQENLPVSAIAFPKIIVKDTLAEVISKKGLSQMHMAESEKERFVTYYFNGQSEAKHPYEEQLIVPSPKVATYDLKPEMSVSQLTSEFIKAANLGKYNFFVVNFANADMVAHTGNIKAAILAVEHLDKAVGALVNCVYGLGGTVIITADHGNAEEMLSYPTTSFFITTEKGKVNTDHSNNPVPVIIISPQFKGNPMILKTGVLSDVAPTVLHLLNIPKPVTMTGTSLFESTKT